MKGRKRFNNYFTALIHCDIDSAELEVAFTIDDLKVNSIITLLLRQINEHLLSDWVNSHWAVVWVLALLGISCSFKSKKLTAESWKCLIKCQEVYNLLVPVVQRLDNAIYRKNRYPMDKC